MNIWTGSDPGLDPMHDAVGKLFLACAAIDWYMNLTVARVSQRKFDDVTRDPHSKKVRFLEKCVPNLPDEESAHLRTFLDMIKEPFEVRNAIGHGVLWGNEPDERVLATKPTRGGGEWERTIFDRTLLLDLGRRLFTVRNTIARGFDVWPPLLGVEPDETP